MPSQVFVTGGSGFVGSAVIEELIARNFGIRALADRREIKDAGGQIQIFHGDLFNSAVLDQAMRDCSAVIHLVGIIMERPARGITFERIHFEGTRSIVDAAIRNGVRRFIHMSALGTRPDAVSNYHKTKYLAEEYVRGSGLDWTILRPSMIHGPKGEFMQMAASWARMSAPPFIFMPYFGGKHAGLLQPVYVKDVAKALVDAVEKRNAVGEVYPIAGPDRMTWPQLHQTIAQAVVGHPRMVASMPVPVARVLAAIGIGRMLGFNRDQVIMSQEDNTCDLSKFEHDFGWKTQPFEPTLRGYAPQL